MRICCLYHENINKLINKKQYTIVKKEDQKNVECNSQPNPKQTENEKIIDLLKIFQKSKSVNKGKKGKECTFSLNKDLKKNKEHYFKQKQRKDKEVF